MFAPVRSVVPNHQRPHETFTLPWQAVSRVGAKRLTVFDGYPLRRFTVLVRAQQKHSVTEPNSKNKGVSIERNEIRWTDYGDAASSPISRRASSRRETRSSAVSNHKTPKGAETTYAPAVRSVFGHETTAAS